LIKQVYVGNQRIVQSESFPRIPMLGPTIT